MVCAGFFNIKILIKIFSFWKLRMYDFPDVVLRGIHVAFGMMVIAVVIVGAAKLW